MRATLSPVLAFATAVSACEIERVQPPHGTATISWTIDRHAADRPTCDEHEAAFVHVVLRGEDDVASDDWLRCEDSVVRYVLRRGRQSAVLTLADARHASLVSTGPTSFFVEADQTVEITVDLTPGSSTSTAAREPP